MWNPVAESERWNLETKKFLTFQMHAQILVSKIDAQFYDLKGSMPPHTLLLNSFLPAELESRLSPPPPTMHSLL